MPDNYLDEFKLSISVEDDNSAEKVNALADAISRLQNSVGGSGLSTAANKIKQVGDKIGEIGLDGLEDKSQRLIQKIGLLQKEFGLVSEEINDGKLNALAENKALQRQVAIAEKLSKLYKEISKETTPPGVSSTTISVDEPTTGDIPKATAAEGAGTQLKATATTFEEINSYTDLWRAQLAEVNKELDRSDLSAKEYLSLSGKRLDLSKKIKDSEEDAAKSQKSGLLSSIKRVAIYRAIRAVLKSITDSLSTGLKGIAQKNEVFNKSISDMSSSLKQVGASWSVALYQPLMAVMPLITSVSRFLVDFNNNLAISIAKITGQSKVMQVNTDYWDNYSDSVKKATGALLAFDTFTTLQSPSSGGAGTSGGGMSNFDTARMFEEIDLSSLDTTEINAALKQTWDILSGIGIALGVIVGAKIINGIADLIESFSTVSKVFKILNTENLMLITGLSMLALGIGEMIANWNNANFEDWEKGVVILAAAVAALATALIAARIGLEPISGIALAAAVGGIVLGVGSQFAAASTPKKFAQGGMLEGAGTMYAIAGESGAEVVARGSAGTGVLNVEQFKEAMVMALYEYGAARGNMEDLQVSMDGQKVGQAVAKSSYKEMRRQGLL